MKIIYFDVELIIIIYNKIYTRPSTSGILANGK